VTAQPWRREDLLEAVCATTFYGLNEPDWKIFLPGEPYVPACAVKAAKPYSASPGGPHKYRVYARAGSSQNFGSDNAMLRGDAVVSPIPAQSQCARRGAAGRARAAAADPFAVIAEQYGLVGNEQRAFRRCAGIAYDTAVASTGFLAPPDGQPPNVPLRRGRAFRKPLHPAIPAVKDSA
jgi:hypothetical protein